MSYPEVYYEFYDKVADVYVKAIAGLIETYDELCKEIHYIYFKCCDDPESSIILGEDEYFMNSAREAEAQGIPLAEYALEFHTERQALVKALENLKI